MSASSLYSSIVAAPCIASNATQTWSWRADGGIESVFLPGLCWDGNKGNTDPGTPVALWYCQSPLDLNQIFQLRGDGTVQTMQTMCVAATAQAPSAPPHLTLQYCNSSVPAATFVLCNSSYSSIAGNTSSGAMWLGAIADGTGACMGGAFKQGDAVRPQPCVAGASSQAWLQREDGQFESAVAPGQCWNVFGGGGDPGTPIALYPCGSESDGNVEAFQLQADGTLASLFPQPSPWTAAMCVATATVPVPFYTALRWVPLSTTWPRSNLSAPLSLWSFNDYLWSQVSTTRARVVSGFTWLQSPAWTASWNVVALTSTPLPPDALGYTAFIPWKYLQRPGSFLLYTVGLTSRALFSSGMSGADWSFVSALPSNESLAGGQLYGIVVEYDCVGAAGCTYLVFYTPASAWVIRGNETDATLQYEWQRMGLPPTACNVTSIFSFWGWPGYSVNRAWAVYARRCAVSASERGLEEEGEAVHVFVSLDADPLAADWVDVGPIIGPFFGQTTMMMFNDRDVPEPATDWNMYFVSTDGVNVSLSYDGVSWYQAAADPFSDRSNPFVAVGAAGLPGGAPRAAVQMPVSASPGNYPGPGLFPLDIQGIVLGGGHDPASGSQLGDMWLGELRLTCFPGLTNPPTCSACPPCGHGACISSAITAAACACDPGWDVASNCTACLPNITCAPALAGQGGFSGLMVSLASGGGAALALLLAGAAYCARRMRWNARVLLAAAEFDVFLSYDWRLGMEAADAIAAKLRASGLRVWRDKDDMGQRMNVSMVAGIRASRTAVLYVTSAYVKRPNCKLEAAQILIRARAEAMPFLLVCAEGFDPLSDVDPLAEQHPIRLLALDPRTRSRHEAVVTFTETFGDGAWCNSYFDRLRAESVSGASRGGTAGAAAVAPVSSDGAAAARAAGGRTLRSIFGAAEAPLSIVYLEEHFEQMEAMLALAEGLGIKANKWAHPKLNAQLDAPPECLRPLAPALRRAGIVILCLGPGFASRASRALHECCARVALDKPTLFVVAEKGYEPASTERGPPTEDEVAAVVGNTIYVSLHSGHTRTSWAAQLELLQKQLCATGLATRRGTLTNTSPVAIEKRTTPSSSTAAEGEHELPFTKDQQATTVSPLLALSAQKALSGMLLLPPAAVASTVRQQQRERSLRVSDMQHEVELTLGGGGNPSP